MLVTDLIHRARSHNPDAIALRDNVASWSYDVLADEVRQASNLFLACGLMRADRVAIYMEKRLDTVAAVFGVAAAGGVFVPVNPLLKARQVAHILNDCSVRLLVTTPERLETLADSLASCPCVQTIIVVEEAFLSRVHGTDPVAWAERTSLPDVTPHRVIDADMAAILYTSGSTGQPNGVVLSHRNLVAGATSVATYLENGPADRILSVLPLSFDYGLSQLTTAFRVGACAVLMNYLLPRDVIRAVERERITGLAAVPPLWVQLAQLDWPTSVTEHLRYLTNSGGHMPRPTLDALRARLPKTKPYLMYGLTEAFRSTYLPPEEVDRRPDSIGKAIPNAEILVVREDGTPCAPGEPGELVHRGVHVALGYWNAPDTTSVRFRPAPGRPDGLPLQEMAVWSGDMVRADEDGFLYFIGRNDELIKTSGYRVSPSEVEDVVYATGQVDEAVAVGVEHPLLGQAVVVVMYAMDADASLAEQLSAECKRQLPAYMVPAAVIPRQGPLPRNPNGKVDRKLLAMELADLFDEYG